MFWLQKIQETVWFNKAHLPDNMFAWSYNCILLFIHRSNTTRSVICIYKSQRAHTKQYPKYTLISKPSYLDSVFKFFCQLFVSYCYKEVTKVLQLYNDFHAGSLGTDDNCIHDDVIKWKHFPRYWPFVRGIHWSPVNSRWIPAQRPVTWSFDVFFDLRLNKRLNKQS